jgi:hypothetical protein
MAIKPHIITLDSFRVINRDKLPMDEDMDRRKTRGKDVFQSRDENLNRQLQIEPKNISRKVFKKLEDSHASKRRLAENSFSNQLPGSLVRATAADLKQQEQSVKRFEKNWSN